MSGKNVIANRYEVISHIGQGGMADVFLAIDTILNRKVAVKILKEDMSADAVSILRFEREAQAAAALQHPNIVEIYDVGDYKGHHYIVMEYVVGETLKHMIRARGRLLKEEAVDIMKQLCSAISEAHSRGIIHRDIKPQNVIVKADGSVKILDFGIATAKGAVQLTQANNVMGSVHYLAPELAKGEKASFQSDIYALGIVFFEMLAGDVPFKADSAVQVALKHMREPMPDLQQINPDVPNSIANIITRATAKQPEKRYSSCDEMLADVATCLNPNRLNERLIQIEMPAKTRTKQEGHKENEDVTDDVYEETGRENLHRHRHVLRTVVISLIIIGLLILIAVFAFTKGFSFFAPKTVPDLTGMSVEEAQNLCAQEEIPLDTENISYELTSDTPEGEIISFDPQAGSELGEDQTISITVSSGIGSVGRDYTGRYLDAVKEELEENYPGLTVKENPVESKERPGTILAQEGITEGELFDAQKTTLTLTYSQYIETYIPADIIGKSVYDAMQELSDLGLTVRSENRDTSQMSQEELDAIQDQIGKVIASDPAAGTAYTQKSDNYITLYYY
jgi:serine/threonine protein kinase